MRCSNCGRDILPGKEWRDAGKPYCSKNCQEYAALQRVVKAARMQSPWYLVLAVLLGAFMVVWATSPRKSWAQQHHHYHQDFYQHWKVPGKPNESCCNARIEYPNGAQTGDCEPTRAEVRKGDWYVWVRQKGEWLKVPDEKIVRYPNPNIFESHLCWTPQKGIICFKPADLGG